MATGYEELTKQLLTSPTYCLKVIDECELRNRLAA